MHFKGRADAWKFLHNHDQLRRGPIKQWAIYLDFDKSIFEIEPAKQDSTKVSIKRKTEEFVPSLG